MSDRATVELVHPLDGASSVRRWQRLKRIALLGLLALSALQYYALDVMLEIASLPRTTYFVPAPAPLLGSALEPPR